VTESAVTSSNVNSMRSTNSDATGLTVTESTFVFGS